MHFYSTEALVTCDLLFIQELIYRLIFSFLTVSMHTSIGSMLYIDIAYERPPV